MLFWFQRSIADFVFITRNHTCIISTYDVNFFIATKLCLSLCTWGVRKAFICKIWPWFIKICIIPLCYISIMLSYFQKKEELLQVIPKCIFTFIKGISIIAWGKSGCNIFHFLNRQGWFNWSTWISRSPYPSHHTWIHRHCCGQWRLREKAFFSQE